MLIVVDVQKRDKGRGRKRREEEREEEGEGGRGGETRGELTRVNESAVLVAAWRVLVARGCGGSHVTLLPCFDVSIPTVTYVLTLVFIRFLFALLPHFSFSSVFYLFCYILVQFPHVVA